MQMSGRSTECVSVRSCDCEFKPLEVAEGSCRGQKTSCTTLTYLCKCILWMCIIQPTHMHGQIKWINGCMCAPSNLYFSLICVSPFFFHIPPLPLFLVMEMINDSSEEAWDKATRADRRERETSFIPASVQRHRFTEFTNCERNEMRLLSLIVLRIHLRSLIVLATYRLSEKKNPYDFVFFLPRTGSWLL